MHGADCPQPANRLDPDRVSSANRTIAPRFGSWSKFGGTPGALQGKSNLCTIRKTLPLEGWNAQAGELPCEEHGIFDFRRIDLTASPCPGRQSRDEPRRSLGHQSHIQTFP